MPLPTLEKCIVSFMDGISLTSQDQEQTYKSLVDPEGGLEIKMNLPPPKALPCSIKKGAIARENLGKKSCIKQREESCSGLNHSLVIETKGQRVWVHKTARPQS